MTTAMQQLTPEFEWQPTNHPPRRLAAAELEQFDRDGYVVLRQVIEPEVVASLTAALDVLEARTESFLRTQPNGELLIAKADVITFTVHAVTQSFEARMFSTHPVLLDLAHDLIGTEVRLYWDQAVYKKPEPDREFPWHQDNGYAFVEPQQYLTCWVPLTPATRQNGCPWIVPGVHRLGTLRHHVAPGGLQCLDQPTGAIAVELEAGDVVAFSSLAPHRTGPNTTAEVRKAYIVQYAPDGAAVVQPDGSRVLADDPARQYSVLVDGLPV
jgi:ectoine hydroxylase-related dioxygenase (phytanoyl-CoA dioxygenase family)